MKYLGSTSIAYCILPRLYTWISYPPFYLSKRSIHPLISMKVNMLSAVITVLYDCYSLVLITQCLFTCFILQSLGLRLPSWEYVGVCVLFNHSSHPVWWCGGSGWKKSNNRWYVVTIVTASPAFSNGFWIRMGGFHAWCLGWIGLVIWLYWCYTYNTYIHTHTYRLPSDYIA